ncbi:MAG: pantetheine-phosphate adenylyltransferase [Helicobacter sp.]|nr:pantetheine-phosphate adenylyltransferase [Helicobacter sp.]
MSIAVYPGTFDPITNGHLDVILRSSKIFSHLIIAVAKSASKKPFFSLKDRVKMVEITCQNLPNVSCEGFSNLLANFISQKGASTVVRGLRMVSDFEYEMQMSYINTSLNKDLDTIFFMPSLENTFISSSSVRQILQHQGKISHLIPSKAFSYIKDKGISCL